MIEEILTLSHARVTELRFNRPDKKNAITRAMYTALAKALEQAAADDAVRAVLLSAQGDTFTAGNDLNDFLQDRPISEEEPVFRFLRAISSFSKPLIAAVQGQAVGVGTTLLLHCDLVILAEGAELSMPFVDLALVPEAASSLLLPRLIGPQRAARHLLLGEPIDARAALDYGIATHLIDRAGLAHTALDLARSLAARPPEAVRLTKELIRADPEPVADRMWRESALFGTRLKSAEAREAFTAFFERRPPRFD